MDNQVPEAVAKDRFNRLLKEVQRIASEEMMKLEGSVQKVLVEMVNEQDASLVTGRLSNNAVVHFKGTADLISSICPVHLTSCKGFYYIGEAVSWENKEKLL